ncbi:MAG: pectate lyase [Planctomycetaceae bacterium]
MATPCIKLHLAAAILFALTLPATMREVAAAEPAVSRDEALSAMRRAGDYYRKVVATHGGYVYFYSLDLERRLGEGVASKDQIWVQPPGTPTVGLAFVEAWRATGDSRYLQAAQAAAEALAYGQVSTGGWTNSIDFDPRGSRVTEYRNGQGRGRRTSSLDDGQTPSALRLLIQVDKELKFRNPIVHDAALFGLDALLRAQYPNGAFPQVWDDTEMPDPPAKPAAFPRYDWRTEGRIKEYWDMYTLNDNVAGYVVQTLRDAYDVYGDERYLAAIRHLGDFLIAAQLPAPQRGWAQQYSYDMVPIWARKFEPPGVSGDETQEVVETLLAIHSITGETKYLEPIPAALDYLKQSLLPDGRLARYYELETNRPLYMERQGDVYSLTYDDSNLPSHYGWKANSRIEHLTAMHAAARQQPASNENSTANSAADNVAPAANEVRKLLETLDAQGRWVSTYAGETLVGQAKFEPGEQYLSSEVFSDNLTTLARYLTSLE